ncbi:predicted protein [Nematostella vectensis]|uniref:Uncharacterized protein n=1 Tax=Nematostella vectensis TaxID=45351 RepID=A7SJE3_NEMVE|nr:predicted protein [Nematostella vectensis]|eukprot:XP_001628231.1 predicted protein [Nematostella vectensis]
MGTSCCAAVFLVLSLLFCPCAAFNGTEACDGMFSTGILTPDSDTLVATTHTTDLEAYKAVVNTSKAWCADLDDVYQFLQVNLGQLRTINSLAIQGYTPAHPSYITKFILSYTTNDISWQDVKDPGQTDPKEFDNPAVDENDVITHPLNDLEATRIRIAPQEWVTWICLRIELFTCDPVNGSFSDWSSWSPCVDLTQTRNRSCDSPAPARGGLDCQGEATQSQACTGGTFTPGYFANLASKNSTNTTCVEGFNCTNFVDPCIPNPCGNDSVCIVVLDASSVNYTCNCTQGFHGRNCTLPVAVPVVAGVGSSAIVTGGAGVIYYIVKRRLAKIAPHLLEV